VRLEQPEAPVDEVLPEAVRRQRRVGPAGARFGGRRLGRVMPKGSTIVVTVIDRAAQVHGARGLTDETPLGAMYAMARGARIYDGPDEVHRMVVARRILKSFAAGDGWRFE
jgi:alkylation response protein AidB-like acyl-CoA dehydrogenase